MTSWIFLTPLSNCVWKYRGRAWKLMSYDFSGCSFSSVFGIVYRKTPVSAKNSLTKLSQY